MGSGLKKKEKRPNDIFCRNRKTYPKIYIKYQGRPNSQNNLEQNRKTRGFTVPDFKTFISYIKQCGTDINTDMSTSGIK